MTCEVLRGIRPCCHLVSKFRKALFRVKNSLYSSDYVKGIAVSRIWVARMGILPPIACILQTGGAGGVDSLIYEGIEVDCNFSHYYTFAVILLSYGSVGVLTFLRVGSSLAECLCIFSTYVGLISV